MEVLEKYKKSLSPQNCKALALCTKLADDMDIKIYLVGGIVRDILLNRQFNDIDVLVEYDAIVFVELLQKNHPEIIEILAKNDKFKTAKLRFKIGGKTFEADFASTRSEIYEYPSALPLLAETGVTLKKDISRRDFTINALALSLNSKDFCHIYDETGLGINDLNDGVIRILHPDSFMDDPSRIVRGLKYRTKLNFILEEDTNVLQKYCLESGKYDNDCQERIKKEVIETLNLLEATCFDKFISENIYKLIISETSKKHIPSGNLLCEIIKSNIDNIDKENVWLIFLCIIFNFAPIDLVSKNSEKLALKKKEQTILTDFFILKADIEKLSKLNENYEIYEFLKQYSDEAILANQCLLKSAENNAKIHLYFNKLKNIKLSVSGLDIAKFGIENGLVYKEILNETLKHKMNENLNENQEKQFFKNLCKKMKE